MEKKQEVAAAAPHPVIAVALPAAPSSSASAASSGGGAKKAKIQEDKSRCWECRKKVGLTGIECRCGYVYCGGHRYADAHNCLFDFKTYERDAIAKANQRVVADTLGEKL